MNEFFFSAVISAACVATASIGFGWYFGADVLVIGFVTMVAVAISVGLGSVNVATARQLPIRTTLFNAGFLAIVAVMIISALMIVADGTLAAQSIANVRTLASAVSIAEIGVLVQLAQLWRRK